MRNSNEDYYTGSSEGWEEIVAVLFSMVAIIGLCFYMYMVFRLDYTSWWTKGLALFFGFIIYVYSVAFIIFGFVAEVKVIKSLIREGYVRQKFILVFSHIGTFFVSQTMLNLFFWGVIKNDHALKMLCIPCLIVVVPSVAYTMWYLSKEV